MNVFISGFVTVNYNKQRTYWKCCKKYSENAVREIRIDDVQR
jgi:hypothetical protein